MMLIVIGNEQRLTSFFTILSLPNGLSGIVPITEVCDEVSALVAKEAEKSGADMDSDEDADDDSGTDGNDTELPEMTSLYKVGGVGVLQGQAQKMLQVFHYVYMLMYRC